MKRINQLRDISRPGRVAKYPWTRILDGTAWELRHGVDFDSSTKCFDQYARQVAKSRGLKVQTRRFRDPHGVDCIQVQARVAD
jgi:hypothetical protein